MIGFIKWGAFIVALLCLIGFIYLYTSCEEEYDSNQNIGWNVINPLYWGEQGGCTAGKEITKWVGIGSGAVFAILFLVSKALSASTSGYDDYEEYGY